jgi:hypothetical protein
MRCRSCNHDNRQSPKQIAPTNGSLRSEPFLSEERRPDHVAIRGSDLDVEKTRQGSPYDGAGQEYLHDARRFATRDELLEVFCNSRVSDIDTRWFNTLYQFTDRWAGRDRSPAGNTTQAETFIPSVTRMSLEKAKYWSTVRRVGPAKFVVLRYVFGWGVWMYLMLMLVNTRFFERPLWPHPIEFLMMVLLGGALVGWTTWRGEERNFAGWEAAASKEQLAEVAAYVGARPALPFVVKDSLRYPLFAASLVAVVLLRRWALQHGYTTQIAGRVRLR